MKAVIDIDNVLADFEGYLVERLVEALGAGLFRQHKRDTYSLDERYKDLPAALAEARAFTNSPSSYGFALPPIEHGVKFANDLIGRGWDVVFASARPRGAVFHNQTSRWLEHYIEDYYNTRGVLLGVEDKHFFAKEWGADILVDDNPDVIKKALEKGVGAFAWDQPWNEGVFPRLMCDREGTVYIWQDESTEEVPFFSVYELEAQ